LQSSSAPIPLEVELCDEDDEVLDAVEDEDEDEVAVDACELELDAVDAALDLLELALEVDGLVDPPPSPPSPPAPESSPQAANIANRPMRGRARRRRMKTSCRVSPERDERADDPRLGHASTPPL